MRSLLLALTFATLDLDVPQRAYAGYPVLVPIQAAGVPNGTTAAVERRDGTAWRQVTTVRVSRERGEAVLQLPRGAHALRVSVAGETSPERTLRVLAARDWSTSRRDDGAYAGRRPNVELGVRRGGREIRGFRATVSTFCVGPTIADNRVFIGTAPLRRARIAPDGGFYAREESGDDTTVEVRGRLRGGRVTGTVKLTFATCSGSTEFSARRR